MRARCECNANWVSPWRPIECTSVSLCLSLHYLFLSVLQRVTLNWSQKSTTRNSAILRSLISFLLLSVQGRWRLLGDRFMTRTRHAHTHTLKHTHSHMNSGRNSWGTTLRTFSLNKTSRWELTFYNSITNCHKLYAHTWMCEYMVL